MRRWGIWAVGTALFVVMGSISTAADDASAPDGSTKSAQSSNSWNPLQWFSGSSTPKANPSDSKPATKASSSPEAEKSQTKSADVPFKAMRQESSKNQALANYLRRQEVCDRLELIAQQTGDVELERLAKQLSQRVWEAYQQHTTCGGVIPSVRESDPQTVSSPRSSRSRSTSPDATWQGEEP